MQARTLPAEGSRVLAHSLRYYCASGTTNCEHLRPVTLISLVIYVFPSSPRVTTPSARLWRRRGRSAMPSSSFRCSAAWSCRRLMSALWSSGGTTCFSSWPATGCGMCVHELRRRCVVVVGGIVVAIVVVVVFVVCRRLFFFWWSLRSLGRVAVTCGAAFVCGSILFVRPLRQP